jgi:hypothetical protein
MESSPMTTDGKPTRFFTGEPCMRGHIAERWVSTGACLECAKLSRHKSDLKHAEKRRAAGTRRERARRQKDPIRFWAKYAFMMARQRAIKRGVKFDITQEYVHSIAVPYCPVLGLILDYKGTGRHGATANSPTVDRLIPALGYVEGNIAVISLRANSIKNDASVEELEKVMTWLRSVLSILTHAP